MTVWLAGMLITADRLNDHEVEEATTTGLTAATGFSITSFSGRKVNGVATIVVLALRTGAKITEIASNTGNCSDTLVATLPSGWIPPETINCNWGNGSQDGEAIINTSGQITLRSVGGTDGLDNNTTFRLMTTWISGND